MELVDKVKLHKNVAIILLVMVSLFMCMILIGFFSDIKSWVYANHTNDKITHILFAAILTVLASYITYPRKVRLFGLGVNLGAVILFFLFTLDETSQVILPGRDADILDLAASYTGLLIGYVIFFVYERVRLSRKHPTLRSEPRKS